MSRFFRWEKAGMWYNSGNNCLGIRQVKGEVRVYQSTRGNLEDQTAAQAIAWGMVPGGGLFVPVKIPPLPWQELRGLNYAEVATRIMSLYLPEFSEDVIAQTVQVYREGIFDGENPAPLVNVGDVGVLELWHGPTAAFKDMALQALPHLLSSSMAYLHNESEVLILVATSGDTGKAALEGFKNVKGTQVVVFFPLGGVSPVQERQMTTTDGLNTQVIAVEGNFDECQTAVKEAFASEDLNGRLGQKGMEFSSANSINWGRLLPQIVYHYWAYIQAVENKKVGVGEPINVAVPTGNFGNLLAAYYAKCMGLPIQRLICASNKNNVLTDFFTTGVYDRQRPFYQTLSPSMDILISSNFERFLYEMSGRDGQKITGWFTELKNGRFEVDQAILQECRGNVYAGWADDERILESIGKCYRDFGYVLDPHTAVALKVYEDYRQLTGDKTFTVVASTASPFKFASSVLRGLEGEQGDSGYDDWEALRVLSQKTGWQIPPGLRGLENKEPRHNVCCSPQEIPEVLARMFRL